MASPEVFFASTTLDPLSNSSFCTNERFYNPDDVNVTVCSADGYTKEQIHVLTLITMITGAMSLVGAGFIIVTFAVFKQLHVPSLKLVLYLSITDLLSSIVYLISAADAHDAYCNPYALCYFQAGLTQFAELASFFWVGCIAFNIYAIAVLRMNERQVNMQHKFYHAFSWGVPAISVIVGAAGGYFGVAGSWCWIGPQNFVARILMLYFWLITVIIVITYLYCHVAFAVRGSPLSLIVGRLRLYVFIFAGAHIFGLINRIQNFIDPCHPIYELTVLQAFFASLQGLANAVAYGLNRSVITQYKDCIRKTRNTDDDDAFSPSSFDKSSTQKLHTSYRGPDAASLSAESVSHSTSEMTAVKTDGVIAEFGYSSDEDSI